MNLRPLLIVLALLVVAASSPAADTLTRIDSLTAAEITVTDSASTTLDLATLMAMNASDFDQLHPKVLVTVAPDNASTYFSTVLTFNAADVVASDTLTIRLGSMATPVTLEATAGTSNTIQFKRTGTPATDAEDFSEVFNANTSINPYASAGYTTGETTVTITALEPGNFGSRIFTKLAAASISQTATAAVNGVDVTDKVSVLNNASATPVATQASTAALTGAIVQDGQSVLIEPRYQYLHLRALSSAGPALVSVVRVE